MNFGNNVCNFYSSSKHPGKPDVSFSVSEAVEADIGEGVSIPRKHKVLVQGVQSQCLCVFSEAKTGMQNCCMLKNFITACFKRRRVR